MRTKEAEVVIQTLHSLVNDKLTSECKTQQGEIIHLDVSVKITDSQRVAKHRLYLSSSLSDIAKYLKTIDGHKTRTYYELSKNNYRVKSVTDTFNNITGYELILGN